MSFDGRTTLDRQLQCRYIEPTGRMYLNMCHHLTYKFQLFCFYLGYAYYLVGLQTRTIQTSSWDNGTYRTGKTRMRGNPVRLRHIIKYLVIFSHASCILRDCAVLSDPSLITYATGTKLPCAGSVHLDAKISYI